MKNFLLKFKELDKQAHMIAGLAVYLAFHRVYHATWEILILVATVAVGKEVIDDFVAYYTAGARASYWDMIFTMFGGFIGVAWIYISDYLNIQVISWIN